ncbi:MAG: YceI family protein [Pseudomonadota bacterium]|nr:YceI family protein [Pseudomonadota bacterium]
MIKLVGAWAGGALIALLGASGMACADDYVADGTASRLNFSGLQAGAAFNGIFHAFTAVIAFNPQDLPASRFDVQVDLKSLDTMDKDRDQIMRGADLFDVARFSTARFVTRSFSKTAKGYSAMGSLTLHGVTRDVPIDFQFAATGDTARLEGSAGVKRLDFGVGQGDWKSTEWVADAVKISFTLVLTRKP